MVKEVRTRRALPKVGSGMADDCAALAKLPDEELLDTVQRVTLRDCWEGAHPKSGLAYDRRRIDDSAPQRETAAIGGTGFGVLAILVGIERGWVTRVAAVARMRAILALLLDARCYHGAFAHFVDGATGATIPFWRKDDGGDLVETSLLLMGLLCAREYFDRPDEADIRSLVTLLWRDVEWDWYTQGRSILYWHWSAYNGWAMNHEVRGWNETLITYVMAASSPRYPVHEDVYHRGFAGGRDFLNGKSYYGIELPLGMAAGGPLFFAHYSFCVLDPRGLKDQYADYGDLCSRHVRINRAHCVANPGGFKGYGESCWGLTASDDPSGYAVHQPAEDNGTISPTAALSSYPYAPAEVLQVCRHLLTRYGSKVWGRYGFVDAFNESRDWYAQTFLAIDQGPIIAMIENQRSGLLWKLFMRIPEIQQGLRKLGFSSPHFGASA